MDQNSGNGTDKRNWRERLGIGNKDLPKLSDDFKPVVAPAVAAKVVAQPAQRPAVKAAPMAPRPAARPMAAPAPIAPRVAPVAPDALANKLRTQRDAAEKLAVQRVQAAKQRAEAALTTATSGAKPKFSFADEEAKIAAAAPVSQPAVQRPIQTQPPRPPVLPAQTNYIPAQAPYPGQVQPPRPQLGVNPGYVMPPAYPQGQPYQAPPPAYQPPAYQPQPYAPQPPAYRPIDPATGYAPQPGFAPPPRQQFAPQQTGVAPSPRLQMPPRAPGFAPNPRLTNPPQRTAPQPQPTETEDESVFEPVAARPPRRATANEYQQAYREEIPYEEESTRSRGLLMILGFGLLALLVAAGVVLGYSRYLKPQLASTSNGTVPVVAAPATPTKTVPDAAAANTATQPVKKQIYDRIEGDHEVLGGQIQSTEEPPAVPAGTGANVQPPATDATGVQPDATGTGNDGVPLPLPPPPGGGTGQQGALQPNDKTDVATNITPAAEQSSAANSSVVVPAPTQTATATSQVVQTPAAPAPAANAKVAAPTNSEIITPEKPPKLVVAKPTPTPPKKTVVDNTDKSLGSHAIVLVPPAKNAQPTAFAKPSKPKPVTSEPAQVASNNSLYGDGPDQPTETATAPVAPPRSKSIFDLFKAAPTPAAPQASLAAAPTVPKVAPAQQVALAAPQVTVPATGTGAYVVQLASFKTKSDATTEYQRLAAKHGAIITRYAPIIETAQVAGSTRYRLNLGTMASSGVASSVCSSLFAAGERDCIVHRQ